MNMEVWNYENKSFITRGTVLAFSLSALRLPENAGQFDTMHLFICLLRNRPAYFLLLWSYAIL